MAGPEKVQYLQTMYALGVRFIAAIVPGRSDLKLPDDTLPGDGDRDREGAYGWTVAAFCRSDSDECPLTLIVAISTGGGPGRAFEGECGDRTEARPALRCGGEARAGLLILSPERAVSSRCVAPRPRQFLLPTPARWLAKTYSCHAYRQTLQTNNANDGVQANANMLETHPEGRKATSLDGFQPEANEACMLVLAQAFPEMIGLRLFHLELCLQRQLVLTHPQQLRHQIRHLGVIAHSRGTGSNTN